MSLIDLTTSCIAQWKMNDNATSEDVINSQGFQELDVAQAQQYTSVLHTTGKVGGALTFNGTSDYIFVSTTFSSILTDSFSWSVWVKPTDGQQIPENDTDIFGLKEMALWFNNRGGLEFYYCIGADGPLITNPVFSDGQQDWHHIVAIAENIESTSVRLTIYFDGVSVDTKTLTGNMANWITEDTSFAIGQMIYEGAVRAGEYFEGSLDNVCLFDKALSASEIGFLYNGGAGTEELTGEYDDGGIMSDELSSCWGF
jgi:hypothetical protein